MSSSSDRPIPLVIIGILLLIAVTWCAVLISRTDVKTQLNNVKEHFAAWQAELESAADDAEEEPTEPDEDRYRDGAAGVSFVLPTDAFPQPTNEGDGVLIYLPFADYATNLNSKEVTIRRLPLMDGWCEKEEFVPESAPHIQRTINGETFTQARWEEGAAGSFYDATNVWTVHEGKCVWIEFVMRAVNPDLLDEKPQPYDHDLEYANFEELISTIKLEAPFYRLEAEQEVTPQGEVGVVYPQFEGESVINAAIESFATELYAQYLEDF